MKPSVYAAIAQREKYEAEMRVLVLMLLPI